MRGIGLDVEVRNTFEFHELTEMSSNYKFEFYVPFVSSKLNCHWAL
jgi:hypothetical protein